jgi:hypothetical protein
MRNFLALAGLLSVVFLALGWYLGWYKIQNTSTPDGRHHIQIDVDADKVKSDVGKGENRVQEILTNKHDSGAPGNVPPTSANPSNFHSTEDGGFIFPASRVNPPTGGTTQAPPR